MKYLLLLLSFPLWSYAGDIKLGSLDQKKLAELLGRLPLDVREKITEKNPAKNALIINSVFPYFDYPFKVKCRTVYYNGSRFFAEAKCGLYVDHTHPDVLTSNDEYKIIIKEQSLVSALYKNISYQNEYKELHSYGKSKGINFDGKETYIFNYYFRCSLEECFLKVSRKSDLYIGTPEEELASLI